MKVSLACLISILALGMVQLVSADQSRVALEVHNEQGIEFIYTLGFEVSAESLERELTTQFDYFHYVVDHPVIPLDSFLFGVPGDVKLSVTAEVLHQSELFGVTPPLYHDSEDSYQTLEAASEQLDQTAYVSGDGWVRSQRIAAVVIHPVWYDGASNRVVIREQIRVRIEFEGEPGPTLARPDPMGQDHELMLQGMLANYQAAKVWRADPEPVLFQESDSDWAPRDSLTSYKIQSCTEPGIYRIRSQVDLIGQSFVTFQLWNQGKSKALLLVGTADGSFDEGDYILFYHEPLRESDGSYNTYSDCNAYWFEYGEGRGRRIVPQSATVTGAPLVPAFSESLRFEQNVIYVWAEDNWMWKEIRALTEETIQLNVPSPDTSVLDAATVTVHLHGVTSMDAINPDHHVRIFFNGTEVYGATWDGLKPHEASFEVAHNRLLDGQNTVRIVVPGDTGAGDFDTVWLNWIKVDYERKLQAKNSILKFKTAAASIGLKRFKVSGFTRADIQVLNLTDDKILEDVSIVAEGATYAVEFEWDLVKSTQFVAFEGSAIREPQLELDAPSDLKNIANQADYLIISHESLIPGLQPFVNLQQSRGYRVEVIEIQDIYDEFSCGIFNVPAIQLFLEYTYTNWTTPAPQYVLFVGEATWDYKGYIPEGVNPNLVPSYTKKWYSSNASTEPTSLLPSRSGADKDAYDFLYGDAMVDNQFVCVSGNDNLPDLFYGRFTAENLAELATMVQKSLYASSLVQPHGWRRNMTFITGGFDDGEQDLLGSQADTLIEKFVKPDFSGLNPVKIYREIDGADWGYYEEQVIRAFNEGGLFLSFFGHAGSWSWETMLDFDDIDNIRNNGKLPFVMSMTCNTVRFANPLVDSFGEHLFLTADANQGALVVWGGCNFGGFWSDYFLTYSFFNNYFINKQHHLGTLINQAKIHNLLTYPSFNVVIEPYTFLGDPAITYTVQSNPALIMGGYFGETVSYSQGGDIRYLIYSMGLEGIGIEKVELYYDGLPTGVFLSDDGQQDDFGYHDGMFGLFFPCSPGLVPQGRYLLEAVGTDYFGNQSSIWPYLTVTQ